MKEKNMFDKFIHIQTKINKNEKEIQELKQQMPISLEAIRGFKTRIFQGLEKIIFSAVYNDLKFEDIQKILVYEFKKTYKDAWQEALKSLGKY